MRGIEVGQVFELGTKYSESLHATFLDQDGKTKPFYMGCYGIGVTRTVAASIEQNHDDDGIIWPVAIAPYEVVIVPANNKSEEVMDAAKKLYDVMEEKADEVVLDDRNERAGIKFKDADLIGYPVRVTIGKKWQQSGNVEIRLRRSGETIEVPYEECKAKVMKRTSKGLRWTKKNWKSCALRCARSIVSWQRFLRSGWSCREALPFIS